MDSLNKTISFVLGLVVVLVFLAVLTGRLNLKKISIFKKSSSTPFGINITPTPAKFSNPETLRPYTTQKTPSTIPATGSPTILLPLLFSGLGGGFFLKRLGKK